MQKTLCYDLPEDPDAISETLPSPGAKYALRSTGAPATSLDDLFVLEASPEALRALARTFAQLADRGDAATYHVHLGATSEEPAHGPGWRISVTTQISELPPVVPAAAATPAELRSEAQRATSLLKDKVVAKVLRPRSKTIGFVFRDGARLFVDQQLEGLELSVESGA